MLLSDGRKIVPIHFTFLSKDGDISIGGVPLPAMESTWRVACTPRAVELHAMWNRQVPWLRTDDPRACTCPVCQNTLEWVEAMKPYGNSRH